MTESRMLLEHGTLLMRLKASNIFQAAEADLKLSRRKLKWRVEPEKMRALGEQPISPEARYSFAGKHVRRAKSALHLIALAYFDPEIAALTDKQSTLIAYRDRALLCEAMIELLLRDRSEFEARRG